MFSKRLILSLLLVSLIFAPVAKAQELVISDIPTPSPTPAPVDYALPYPGILPGHFLYSLKVFRDKAIGLLTSNPLKKAEFNLLQADKRIETGRILFSHNRSDEGQSTFSKALNYFEEAVNQTTNAKKQGMDTADISKRLKLANKKHQEVIKEVKGKRGDKDGKLANEEKRLKELEKMVSKLSP
jgi:hypothetical protein